MYFSLFFFLYVVEFIAKCTKIAKKSNLAVTCPDDLLAPGMIDTIKNANCNELQIPYLKII